MMDWNGDGRYDHKDDAFYNNVLSNELKSGASNKIQINKSTSHKTSSSQQSSVSNNSNLGWFILLCVVYLFLRMF